MKNHIIWCEKYRPMTIEDCILPPHIKDNFQTFVYNGECPNLILSGGPGMGKTSIAKALMNELDADYLMINGSLSGNIDTLRNDIAAFASTVSMNGGRKYVILDEADYLNPNSTQPALRGFIEEFSKNCGFILTCNYVNKILVPLQSRLSHINFTIAADDKPIMAKQFLKRVEEILKKEGVEYNRKVVIGVLKKYFPDFRKILNELQYYAAHGKIDTAALGLDVDSNMNELIAILKVAKYNKLEEWVEQNGDVDFGVFTERLYHNLKGKVNNTSLPAAILIIGEYLFRNSHIGNQKINMLCMLTELMQELAFK